MTKVLLICNDFVGENMAGPGIRYWELTRTLGRSFDVTLAIPPFVATPSLSFDEEWLHVCHTKQELRALVTSCDVIITLGIVFLLYPFVIESGKPLIVDLYDPFLLEDLQRKIHQDWLERLASYENYLHALRIQMQEGDFFICAGEKQRDYWLGMLSAMGRVNPYTYQDDPSLRRLIDVVPFGLPPEPPQHTRAVLKGIFHSIGLDDKVILWGGGIWDWFDAQTLIKAMPRILARREDVKLFFMGVKRSNQQHTQTAVVNQAISLSQEMGLYEKHIFFNDWVPYKDRQNYLLESDVGVSLHLDHIETRFAFRTRLLDYLWAGLPIVSTSGDVIGENLASYGLANLVAPGDVEGVAQAILHILDKEYGLKYRDHTHKMAEHYHWDVVVKPLEDFCADPHLAPDKDYLSMDKRFGQRLGRFRHIWRKGVRTVRLRSFKYLIEQVYDYMCGKIREL